jgi:hypothetical protein
LNGSAGLAPGSIDHLERRKIGEEMAMSKTKVGVAVVATAAAGSVALGGMAMAGTGNAGGNGTGGKATNNCLNVGIPILSGTGLLGQGTASGASCDATANGTGGNAY